MTATYLVSLMRTNNITIRELKARTGITLKRIREVRLKGLQDLLAARDWIQAITGADPGELSSLRS